MNISERYIFKALLAPTVFVGLTITGLLMLDRIYNFLPFFELTEVKPQQFIQVILYTIPSVLFLVMPFCVLIGCYIGLSGLSKHSEIIAFQSIGLPVYFFLKPILLLGFIAWGFGSMFSMWLSPLSFTKLESLKFDLLSNSSKFKFEPQQIHHFGDNIIFSRDSQDDELQGVFIAHWEQPGKNPIITGKKAKLQVLAKQGKILFNIEQGVLHLPGKDGNYQFIQFEQFTYPIQIPTQSRSVLPNHYRKITNQEQDLDKRLAYSLSMAELLTVRDNSITKTDYYEYWAEYVFRFMPPINCISFALVALAFGISNPRSGTRLEPLYLLLTLLVNYSISTQIHLLADAGEVNPWLRLLAPAATISFALLMFEFRYKAFSGKKVPQNI